MQINSQSRDVFYVSDGTAITCETLGHVVLGQFSFIPNEKTFPFVESEDKVADVIKEIEVSIIQLLELRELLIRIQHPIRSVPTQELASHGSSYAGYVTT